jgi:hypothetical protein
MREEDFYCVEVKGLNLSSGNIMMTEKEFTVARELERRYCLFVVANFVETPNHRLYFNPLDGKLDFKRVDRKVIQTSYVTSV